MVNEQFCKLLKEAIKDEENAPIGYSKLIITSPEPIIKIMFADIIKDERKHKETLEQLDKIFCDRGS